MKKSYFYQHPSGKIKIIDVGFCWPACIFGPLWALVNKIWDAFFNLLAISVLLNFYLSYAEAQKSVWLVLIGLVMSLSVWYICGKIGNSWHMMHLEKRGYVRISESSIPENAEGYSHSFQVPAYEWKCLSCGKEKSPDSGACVSCGFPANPYSEDLQVAEIKRRGVTERDAS